MDLSEETYTQDDASHTLHIVGDMSLNMECDETIKGLFNHSKMFGYKLFKLNDINTKEFYCYGVTIQDFKKFLRVKGIPAIAICMNDENIEECLPLEEDYFEELRQRAAKNITIYSLQRLCFPNNSEFREKITKKIEFEAGYRMFTKLSDIVVFKQQYEIAGFRLDFLFELKSAYNGNVPTVGWEIDEDGHRDRDQYKEQERQKILEYFTNRLVRTSINRTASDEEIEQAVSISAEQIRNLVKDLTIEFTSELTLDTFLQRVSGFNIDRDFLNMFFKRNEEDPIFKYNHEEVAKFLGFTQHARDGGYVKFIKIMKRELQLEKDYVPAQPLGVGQEHAKDRVGKPNEDKTRSDGRGLGGAGKNKKYYKITRLGFYYICLHVNKIKAKQYRMEFAKVYEACMDLCQSLRHRTIVNIQDTAVKKERVDTFLKQSIEKKKTSLDNRKTS